MLNKDAQGTENRRAVEGHHTLLHIGQSEGMIILNNLAQYHKTYGGRAYTQLSQHLLCLIHIEK